MKDVNDNLNNQYHLVGKSIFANLRGYPHHPTPQLKSKRFDSSLRCLNFY